jgi:hypothetical protein
LDEFSKPRGALSTVDETPLAPQATVSWYTSERKRYDHLVRKPALMAGTGSEELNKGYSLFSIAGDVG